LRQQINVLRFQQLNQSNPCADRHYAAPPTALKTRIAGHFTQDTRNISHLCSFEGSNLHT
jgi:hypothetical protein